jgi:hypothetical protein
MTLLRRRGPFAKRTGLFRMLGHASLNTAGGDGAGRFRGRARWLARPGPRDTRGQKRRPHVQEDMLLRHASQRRILAGSVGGATGKKKGPGSRRGRCAEASVGSLTRRFGSLLRSTGTGSDGLRFRFAAVEPAHGVRPNRPRGDLGGGGLLSFAGNLVNRT